MDKKEQIINSARELFTTYGYKKVSMDEIATNANVTKKTIYAYFKDKDELYRYFVIEEIENMKKIVEKIDLEDLPFVDKMHKMIYDLLKYQKNAKFIVMLSRDSQSLNNVSVKKNLLMLQNSIRTFIKNKLKVAIEKKQIINVDVEVASYLIYKIYVSLFYDLPEELKKIDEKRITDTIIAILKNGIFYKEDV